MARTLTDLLFALLNATFILLALCLFLGWKLATTVDDVATTLAQKVQVVAPLREEVQGVRGELTALRSELSSLQSEGNIADSAVAEQLSTALGKLEQLEAKLQTAQARIADFAESPNQLIRTAIDTSVDVIADRVIAIRGCVPET